MPPSGAFITMLSDGQCRYALDPLLVSIPEGTEVPIPRYYDEVKDAFIQFEHVPDEFLQRYRCFAGLVRYVEYNTDDGKLLMRVTGEQLLSFDAPGSNTNALRIPFPPINVAIAHSTTITCVTNEVVLPSTVTSLVPLPVVLAALVSAYTGGIRISTRLLLHGALLCADQGVDRFELFHQSTYTCPSFPIVSREPVGTLRIPLRYDTHITQISIVVHHPDGRPYGPPEPHPLRKISLWIHGMPKNLFDTPADWYISDKLLFNIKVPKNIYHYTTTWRKPEMRNIRHPDIVEPLAKGPSCLNARRISDAVLHVEYAPGVSGTVTVCGVGLNTTRHADMSNFNA